MKKAIFGGSFDPPHLGHLEIIEQALLCLDIDELIVVPTFINPFKSKSYAPAHLRLKWLKSMTKKMKKVQVSSFEIDQNRPVPSIETVRHFKTDEVDTLYFIIGADNLKNLSSWNSYEALNAMVTWVVATRDKIEIPSSYLTLNVNQDISATELRKDKLQTYLSESVAQEIITYYNKDTSNG